jgi:hypothetical protein
MDAVRKKASKHVRQVRHAAEKKRGGGRVLPSVGMRLWCAYQEDSEEDTGVLDHGGADLNEDARAEEVVAAEQHDGGAALGDWGLEGSCV